MLLARGKLLLLVGMDDANRGDEDGIYDEDVRGLGAVVDVPRLLLPIAMADEDDDEMGKLTGK